MFAFYDSKQEQSNQNYYKGVLFENLLRDYIKALGYNVTLSRIKENSVEYDILGEHTLDKRIVIGEAKAHEKPISAEIFQAFVGKFMTYYLKDKNKHSGIFYQLVH